MYSMFGMDGIAKYNIISKTPESLPSSLNYNRTADQMTDRPRRSTRPPAKILENKTVTTRPKRKLQGMDPTDQLQFLLQNPKSALTSMDISVCVYILAGLRIAVFPSLEPGSLLSTQWVSYS